MIEDDDELLTTSADDEIRRAFGGVISAILDGYEAPARRKAVEEVLLAHERIRRIFTTAQNGKAGGVTALWLDTRLH